MRKITHLWGYSGLRETETRLLSPFWAMVEEKPLVGTAFIMSAQPNPPREPSLVRGHVGHEEDDCR